MNTLNVSTFPFGWVQCRSGLKMSVKVGKSFYCEPRVDGVDVEYAAVEIGYPSTKITELMEYAENEYEPTDTVYAWVPVSVLLKVIYDNGGIGDGDEVGTPDNTEEDISEFLKKWFD